MVSSAKKNFNYFNHYLIQLKLNGDASHRLRREVFVRTIKQFSKFSTKQLSNLYDSIDGAKRGSISFNDFVQATQPDLKFKALYEPSRLFSKRTKSESQ